MKTELLNYYLPPELIAQRPAAARSGSRLLVLSRTDGRITDSRFSNIGSFLKSGDLLVLNDTKVLPARFFAQKTTGGKIEGLFLSEKSPGVWEVMLKGLAKVRCGSGIYLKDKKGGPSCRAVMLERTDADRCLLKVESGNSAEDVLRQIGFPPLPPYIKRTSDPGEAQRDILRYQTVYARRPGAVAAPTAGLHFTAGLLGRLEKTGICSARITLHVGTGTFKPVTAETLDDHPIHHERFSIDSENASVINAVRRGGQRIIAVGTTSVRALEAAQVEGQVGAIEGTTGLFIKPGYKFKAVDAMITNFHLPKSTLLALVAAFAGLDLTLAAYRHAIEKRYRFYSYGDAMLIV